MNSPEDENSYLVGERAHHSFLDIPIGSFKGPNSLHHFATSFTRAQSFAATQIDNDIHRERSFFDENSDIDDELFDPELMIPSARGERLSVVIHDITNKNQLFVNYETGQPGGDVFYDGFRSRQNSIQTNYFPRRRNTHAASFSSIRSAISQNTLTLKKIEDKNGNIITVIAGQSTAPQTIFNSINVLIGVGLLALPVGLNKAGWILGLPVLCMCGLLTYWTARLLSRSMDTDSTIMTYADLGFAAYGSTAKLLISLIFSIDLTGAGVALIVLFSDSLYALLGDEVVWTKLRFKLVSFLILTPFTFLPLPILSIFSLFGIISTISITLLVFVCGVLKSDAPGSLLDVMPTNIWPNSTKDMLLAIGILMAPFGGHAIFPNLKSDMRHPYKFTQTLTSTYLITLLTDVSMAILGFLMYGNLCSNEITNNILLNPGYPAWCYPLLSGLICLIPLAKTPLNAKPIISTLDVLFGIDRDEDNGRTKNFVRGLGRFLVRVGVNALFVVLAILFPEFEKIIGILGSSICFLVCIILPCLFYLKSCDVGNVEKGILLIVLLVSITLSLLGTWAVVMF